MVDARQSLYFQQIFKILELWGFEQAKQAYHLGYEIVALPDGVISSRKGNVAALRRCARPGAGAGAGDHRREEPGAGAGDERRRSPGRSALGSLKYAMLARDNNKVVIFDLDEALSFDGHAAPYIQYAHARACRILENSRRERRARSLLPPSDELDFGDVQPEELALLQEIASLPEEIQRAAAEYRPLLIASYVFELAKPSTTSITPARCCHRRSRCAPPGSRWSRRLGRRSRMVSSLLGIEAPEEM